MLRGQDQCLGDQPQLQLTSRSGVQFGSFQSGNQGVAGCQTSAFKDRQKAEEKNVLIRKQFLRKRDLFWYGWFPKTYSDPNSSDMAVLTLQGGLVPWHPLSNEVGLVFRLRCLLGCSTAFLLLCCSMSNQKKKMDVRSDESLDLVS